MNKQEIIECILDNKEIIYLVAVLLTLIFLLVSHVKYATALQSCTAKIEQYKQDEPKLDVGEGGFDTWESNLVPNG